jgi:hypothetical protein
MPRFSSAGKTGNNQHRGASEKRIVAKIIEKMVWRNRENGELKASSWLIEENISKKTVRKCRYINLGCESIKQRKIFAMAKRWRAA